MVQIFQEPHDPRDASTGVLASALGQGLAKGINSYNINRSLQSVMQDKSLAGKPVSERLGAFQNALLPYGEEGQRYLQNVLMKEQQAEQESEREILAKVASGENVSSKELKKVSPENQMKVLDLQKRKQAGKSVYESLKKAGYPDETASLWQNQIENSPVGGQTDVIKNVNDLIKRSKSGKGLGQEQVVEKSKPSIEIPGIESDSFDLDFPELPEPVGLTPADTVRQNEHREKVNVPMYTETVDRLNALDDEFREVKHLQELNEIPGALPTGIQKWNVNWDTGDLRVKALATPEAQDYVKTIARMARRAKDFFPGRVTNFDLDQFKQGFPTLANSPEGRRIIAEQLSLGNRIAYLKDETLKAAYDHYGSGADPILVKQYATQNYRRLKGQLEAKLSAINNRASEILRSELSEESASRPSLEEIFK